MKDIFRPRAISVSFLLLLAACSARQGQNPDILTGKETSKEWFDPFGDAEDTVVATRLKSVNAGLTDDSLAGTDSHPGTASIYPRSVFRVQVFATQYYYRAVEEKRVAAEALAQEASVSYLVPYYRVQVGNARSRAQAEQLLQLARQLGYEQSWIVEVQVDTLFWIQLAADSATVDTSDVTGPQE